MHRACPTCAPLRGVNRKGKRSAHLECVLVVAHCVLLLAHHRESALWARITLAMFRLKFPMSVCVFFVDVSRVTCLNVHVHYINFVPCHLSPLFSIFSTPFAKNKSGFLFKNRSQNLPSGDDPHNSGPIQWARGGVGLKPSAAARPETGKQTRNVREGDRGYCW